MQSSRAAFALAFLACCSRTGLDDGPTAGPIPHALNCHAPTALACSQLVVESSDVALDGPVPIDFLEWRGDHFVALTEWASGMSLVISGTPATLHVGASEGFVVTGDHGIETMRAFSTNGLRQTILTGNWGDRTTLRFYDADDSAGATFQMSNVSTNTDHIATYDNLTLFQYERDTYDRARVGIVDDTGTLVREEPLGLQHAVASWGLPGAYGCGFFYAPTPQSGTPVTEYKPTLVFVRVDGELETEALVPRMFGPTFDAWPYDEHAIAVSWVDQPDAGACTVHLHVVRDDGTALVDRTYASSCYQPATTYDTIAPTRLFVTQFGAVLRMPDWTLSLLDDAGNEIGTRVAITVGDASKEYMLYEAAGDAYIAALTVQLNASAPHVTLIGCR